MQVTQGSYRYGVVGVVAGILALMIGPVARGVTRTYTLVTAESVITASGNISTTNYGSANIQTQGPGSLTTTYSGTIRTDRILNTANSIAFIGGSVIDANTNGTWQPTATGASGSALADYGGRASFAGGLATANLAARNLVADLLSGSLVVTNGVTGNFPINTTDVQFDSGNFAYRATGPFGILIASGTESLAGESGDLGGVNPGSISIASIGGGMLRETLTIPINSIITLNNVSPDIQSVTLNLIGQLKATADFADDGLRYWNNTAGGTFGTANNWNPSLTPGATETAIFSLGSNYAVTFSGAATNNRLRVGNTNQVTFNLGTNSYSLTNTSTTTPSVVVGETAGATSRLTLAGTGAGGTLSSVHSFLGSVATSTGQMIVGAGATWNNSGELSIGRAGTGSLTIQSGGDFVAPAGGITYLGYATGSSGSATITGAGSTMTNGQLFVGRQGTGTMSVTSGGLVSSTTARIGNQATGGVTVSGTSTFTNTNTLFVGEQAQGTLSIQSGSILNTVTTNVGTSTGSNSTVTITGNNSTWNSSGSVLLGGTGSTSGGQGTININTGGDFVSPVGGITYVGYATGSTGSVTVTGAGSTMTNGQLYVGRQGSGSMTVSSGGLVSSTTARIGSQATGGVTVSLSSTFSSTNTLFVGEQAQGTLSIQSGSTLNSVTTHIGSNAGSNGTVTVTGTNSTWNNTGSIFVGGTSGAVGNTAVLNINSNASVDVANTLRTWSPGTVNLTSGKLKTATLNITQGTFNHTGGQLVANTVSGNLTRAGGSLTPGDSLLAGQTTISGNYIQQAGASLAIELGGLSPATQFDRLLVSGVASLDGTLNVSLINSFIPTVGNSFQVLSATGGISSAFTTHNLPSLTDADWEWLIDYTASSLTLAVGLKGDFNRDGIVNAADYVVWRDSDGSPSQYDIWRSQFGDSAAPGAASSTTAAVPEPATWVLFAVACIGLLGHGMRRP